MRTIMMTIAAIAITTSANALTLKKGEVLTEDGVMHASQTANGMAQIEEMGFYVAGGQPHLSGDVSIDLSDAASAASAAAEVADAAYTGA